MPRFVFSLALDSERDSAYQMNTIDHFDQGLVTAVLEFARERHLAGEVKDARPFTVAPGFMAQSHGFDVVVAVPPVVHQYHFGRDNALSERVTGVFPAYRCEFSGSETLEEAVHRFKRMLRPTVVGRPVAPYLRMRYENTRTGSGSLGTSRGFTTTDVLLRELALLEGAVGSFVEWENFRGEVWHVTWDGSWFVNGGVQSEPLSEIAVLSTLGCSKL
ncbi:hypothetical protein PV682_40885 [Streptomyces niveiscabiei]|uniref:hypothetical protein n=1 Tax=Streptomyces niveiscabiei TaxID=164115 RepID=UPI0029B2EF0C|nr:hypothetical protein [Streptomyces niveiscabiei]MDX3387757.1 hypothetical protein [Streptomyces niveiscabiei]